MSGVGATDQRWSGRPTELAGPLMSGVCARRVGMASVSSMLVFGRQLALVLSEASLTKLVGLRLRVHRCCY